MLTATPSRSPYRVDQPLRNAADAHAGAAHLSRTSPLCASCAHGMQLRESRSIYCNHPGAPVDPVGGLPVLRAEVMRQAEGARGLPLGVPVCGPEGRLFAAQGVGDVGQRADQPIAD